MVGHNIVNINLHVNLSENTIKKISKVHTTQHNTQTTLDLLLLGLITIGLPKVKNVCKRRDKGLMFFDTIFVFD